MGVTGVTSLAKAISSMAVVKKVVLSHNFIFGSQKKAWDNSTQVHAVDADQTGWSALCDALPGSPVEELIVAEIGMGTKGVTSLAKAISAGAALTSLTVDSTGDMYYRKAYTLTAGKANINLSQKHLGPADMTLLTGWMQRPEVSAVLVSVNLSRNRAIDQESRSALQESVSSRQPTIELIWDK
jgi:hypothetical protein